MITKENIIKYLFFLFAFFSIASITIAEIFYILIILIWLFDFLTRKINIKRFFNSPFTLPIILFILVHFISAIFGIDPLNSLKDARKVYLILMFFLSAYYIKEKNDIKDLFLFFVLGSVFIGIYAIFTSIYFKYIKGISDFRASSFSGNHMHLGGMFIYSIIVTLILLILSIKERKVKETIFYTISFILIFLGLLFTYTRGAWLASFLGILIVLFFIDKKWFLSTIIFFVLLFLLTINTSFSQRIIRTFTCFSGDSANERIQMWKSGINIIRDYPIFGIGTANLEKIYPKYIQKEAKEKNQGHLHNNILQITVIDGIFGLLFFLWIFTNFFIYFFKTFLKAQDIFYKYFSLSIFAMCVAFFCNGFFEYNFFSSQVVLILWFFLGIGENIRRKIYENN